MSAKEFLSFVSNQNQIADKDPLDRAATMKSWFENIDDLFNKVSSFLKPFLDDGTISIRYQTISMNEEWLGIYETRKLIIKIGANEVELVPVGRMIFGAQGRVDIKGPIDFKKLLLVPADLQRFTVKVSSQHEAEKEPVEEREITKLAWKFSVGPRHDYTELTEDTFTSALMAVIR
jgi:hypothetical protein